MKVFFPFAYYYPEQCAGIYVVEDLMQSLSESGDESYLSVPTPTRNVKSDEKWKRTEVKYDDKVVVHRFRMYGEGRNPLLRAFRYLLCEIVQLHYMLWKDYDVAFIDSTPPIQGLKLPIVKLLRKKPIIYNAQDLFPETLSGAGLAKKGGLLWKIGMWVSNVTFRNSDKIIAISNDIKKSMIARGIPADKIEVVYNWVDEKAVKPVAKEDNPLYDEFGISKDKFNVVYAGNLGNAQNVMLLVEAAKKLKDDDSIQIVIFGTGGIEQDLKTAVSENELNNVKMLPLQPMERVPFVYGVGDVCVVACKEGLGGSAMPSKTWTIMSCGKSVLANFDEGELKHIIEDNNCGVFTKAGDVDAFVDAIKELKKQESKCEELGKNGRAFVLKNLNKDICTQKYVEVIKSFEKK